MSDYLWDRSGPPDEVVAELERKLSPLKHSAPLDTGRLGVHRARPWPYAAIAASIVLGAMTWPLQPGAMRQSSAWSVTGVQGHANVAASPARRLYRGQQLRTGHSSRVTLEADDFGQVEVESNSELRISDSNNGTQRMSLQRGRIHAFIWAPPQQFVVDTPSARTIDLGCEYNLSVDGEGNGFVTVETGWVAFQFNGRESFIPAGAACRTTKRAGPGVPFFEDAAGAFKTSLSRFESTADPAALTTVLAEARARDGLSLWHLLSRVSGADRRRVFDRFAELIRLPGEVVAERAITGDRQMLDLCWNALELDDADWWREWKREWKP